MKRQAENAAACVSRLSENFLSPLDLLSHSDFREKCIDLIVNNIPPNVDHATATQFHELRKYLLESRVDDKRVVLFGGGTGLSNIIGGDSRQKSWSQQPFSGLKEIFPRTRSIVCVTDDGGSTGQLIKDLPLIALGDLRHVILSSVQQPLLQERYGLTLLDARNAADSLATLINARFGDGDITKGEIDSLLSSHTETLPEEIKQYFEDLAHHLVSDTRLEKTIGRSHCLGNLLIVAAIYKYIPKDITNSELEYRRDLLNIALHEGIKEFSLLIGAGERAVMPCTSTPAQLRFRYGNGVEVSGEHKSGQALRGYPVDRVIVDFSDEVHVYDELLDDIARADIMVMAPGSLYSSIIPIFQTPGIADAVRQNTTAQKILVSNLWVQAGETDIAISDPERKFHVSDMIKAYERNIPGGTRELFHEVLCLSLKDVPASILQNYALEDKIPIYLDKKLVRQKGYVPVECGIYSREALAERGVIQHDPDMLAQAVKTVFVAAGITSHKATEQMAHRHNNGRDAAVSPADRRRTLYPSCKYRLLESLVNDLPIACKVDGKGTIGMAHVRQSITELIWKHPDISLPHLQFIKGIVCVDKTLWRREQVWDRVFSFFDPEDFTIKIRADQLDNAHQLEIAILVAIGQSLLGDYAAAKKVESVVEENVCLGKVYNLHLRAEEEMRCYFSLEELATFLTLSRMFPSPGDRYHYTRLINGDEGFTPPGMFMGLFYAWYLDNRLASHIEYKMALMKMRRSDLIPEQDKMLRRRKEIIDFFRDKVFINDHL